MPKQSFAASTSAAIGILGLAAVGLGPGLIHAGVLPPLAGFGVFAAGAVLGIVLSLAFGFTGLVRTRGGRREGRPRALLGVGAGASLAVVLGISAGGGGGAPPIHDVTTNIDDPPTFSAAIRDADDRANGVDYPDGGSAVPEQQRQAFPDLTSIEVALPPDAVLERSRQIAEALGWNVTSIDPAKLIVEAHDITSVFRFVDDVVIRVRPSGSGSGSSVDLRSNSRVGGGDLGANAARIRAFREQLLAGS